MIILFHIFLKFIYKWCKISKKNESQSFTLSCLNSNSRPLAERDAENGIRFDPPVYKQRYERATEVLTFEKWCKSISKVVDFGCSELGLFVFLKHKIQAEEILFVDIDEALLQEYLFRIDPLNIDYLIGRKNPLTVKVYKGSIADPDPNLLNTDAVVALEIIEHLYPDVLEAVPYNLFGFICPKLVVVTTPNADFNVLFKRLNGFRHPDHKFEWTREQFQSWASNITSRFPRYTVTFDGIGEGPEGSQSLGSCSQMAVFIRKDVICDIVEETERTCESSSDGRSDLDCDSSLKYSFGICTYNSCSSAQNISGYEGHKDSYKLVASVEYPIDMDTRTEEQKMLDEIKYRMHLFATKNESYYNFEKDRIEIPIDDLAYNTSGPTASEVRTALLKSNYRIEECLNRATNRPETCVVYEPEMDVGGSSSDTEASGYESDKCNVDEAPVSDWDEEQPNEETETSKAVKTQLHLEVSSGSKKQGLYDSGYQKSPSTAEESPQATSDPIPLTYKAINEKPNRLSNILSVFDNFDKINELDAFRKEKKFFNFSSNLSHREVMKKICQEIAKHPVAGPSRDPKRGRNSKKSPSSESEESVEEVKSIATCILENSLNRIECKEEEPRGNLIQELIPEAAPQAPLPEPAPPLAEPVLVENGDLANNNRDLEGNNYVAENVDVVDNIDVDRDDVEDNNNEYIEPFLEELPEEVEEAEPPPPDADVEVAWSSREALFDANSQVDLLEDFDMDAPVAFPSNYVVGNQSEAVLPPEESNFPNWLLQIFEEGEGGAGEEELHDEPHYYCQGDGLGVHPSTVAVNDDADDEETDSGSDESSSSGSVAFSSAENQSVHDLLDPGGGANALVVVGQPVAISQPDPPPEEEETFENAEESESNLIPSACTR